MTVEELFTRVDRMMSGDGFSVRYDDAFGYPVEGSFDPLRNSIDDEWGFSVESFVALS